MKDRVIVARLASFVVDSLILLFVLFVFNSFLSTFWLIDEIVSSLITFGYFIYFHWKTGQTYGKKLFNIRVVDNTTGGKVEFVNSLKRESIWILISVIEIIIPLIGVEIHLPFFNLSYLATVGILATILIDANSRGIHDKLAHTKVISTLQE
jgi:uncharacterized RDD family membrane protein YckC